MRDVFGLFYSDEGSPFENGITGVYVDRSHTAVAACADRVFHLHGLEHNNGVACLDGVADFDSHRYNHAWEWCDYRAFAAGGGL